MPLTKKQKTAVGKAIGATPPEEKERRTVRVDLTTLGVYSTTGNDTRIGVVQSYTRNEGARTPTGGKFTSHRITVKFKDDDRAWVGQIKSKETLKKTHRKTVILRPLEDEK